MFLFILNHLLVDKIHPQRIWWLGKSTHFSSHHFGFLHATNHKFELILFQFYCVKRNVKILSLGWVKIKSKGSEAKRLGYWWTHSTRQKEHMLENHQLPVLNIVANKYLMIKLKGRQIPLLLGRQALLSHLYPQ